MNELNGCVIINKPKDLTSRAVVNQLNKIFGTKKIGHTGTLDPLATGVLVCLIGKYTKLVDLITSYEKEYIAEVKLGIQTDTLDITGNILKEGPVNITQEELIKVLNSFIGKYQQTVPKYSAVKINGKKLYEYARNNIDIPLPTKEVEIKSIELLEFNEDTFKIKTLVSKGCYIRSLINDITSKLNAIGTMSALERTKQGNFTLDNASSLEDITNGNYHLLTLREFLPYPIIELDNDTYHQVKNGSKIPNTYNISDKGIFTYQNKDIAIYTKEDNLLRVYLML